jgi:hypothetical protein
MPVLMESFVIAVGRQAVDVECPDDLAATLHQVYGDRTVSEPETRHSLSIEPVDSGVDGLFELSDSFGSFSSGMQRSEVIPFAVEALTRIAVYSERDWLALKADLLIKDGHPVVVADTGGPGRAITTVWLSRTSFTYGGSDWVLIDPDGSAVLAQQCAVMLDAWVSRHASRFPFLRNAETHGTAHRAIAMVPHDRQRHPVSDTPLFLFPHFEEGSQFLASMIGPDECAVRLSQCLLNSPNLAGGGLDQLAALSRQSHGLSVRFGALDQLDQLEAIAAAVIDSGLPPEKLLTLANAMTSIGTNHQTAISVPPKATPSRGKKRLTIGMATFDDYDGVYFTLQSLRLHHAQVVEEAELIVVDNNPTGACAQALKKLEVSIPNFRYVPHSDNTGPSGAKDRIFQEATGDYVLAMDCHVLLAPGSLARLDDYLHKNPETGDLLQGPMIRGDLRSVYTHWDPIWRKGMFGIWAEDQRGVDPDLPPFDIPMQGSGLFACRRDAWPGFNPLFRGFGGEEGYMHEKIRQNGGRTLCLPFLRWLHRFARPMGVPYRMVWEDRLRNYLIGFQELGLPTEPIVDHFNELIGDAITQDVLEAVKNEFTNDARSERQVCHGP